MAKSPCLLLYCKVYLCLIVEFVTTEIAASLELVGLGHIGTDTGRLDVHGWKYQFNVKNTLIRLSKTRNNRDPSLIATR